MNKPKITSGRWRIEVDNIGVHIATDYDKICDVYTHDYDAEAISKVPELIDELIKEAEFLQKILDECLITDDASYKLADERLFSILLLLEEAGGTYE